MLLDYSRLCTLYSTGYWLEHLHGYYRTRLAERVLHNRTVFRRREPYCSPGPPPPNTGTVCGNGTGRRFETVGHQNLTEPCVARARWFSHPQLTYGSACLNTETSVKPTVLRLLAEPCIVPMMIYCSWLRRSFGGAGTMIDGSAGGSLRADCLLGTAAPYTTSASWGSLQVPVELL